MSSVKELGNEDERKQMRKRNKCYDMTSLSAGANNEVVFEGKDEVRVEILTKFATDLFLN